MAVLSYSALQRLGCQRNLIRGANGFHAMGQVSGVSHPGVAVCEGVFQQSVTHGFCLLAQSGVP